MHLFHAKCFEENKEGPNDENCPLCQEKMKLVKDASKTSVRGRGTVQNVAKTEQNSLLGN